MNFFKTKTRIPSLYKNFLLIQQIYQDFYNQQNYLKYEKKSLLKNRRVLTIK